MPKMAVADFSETQVKIYQKATFYITQDGSVHVILDWSVNW
jgi:hypothetical protein